MVQSKKTTSGTYFEQDALDRSGFDLVTWQSMVEYARTGACVLNRDGAPGPLGEYQGKPMAIKVKTTQGVGFLTGTIALDQDVVTLTSNTGELSYLTSNFTVDQDGEQYKFSYSVGEESKSFIFNQEELKALQSGEAVITDQGSIQVHTLYQRQDGKSAHDTHLHDNIEEYGVSQCVLPLRQILQDAKNYNFSYDQDSNTLSFKVKEDVLSSNKKCKGWSNIKDTSYSICLSSSKESDINFDDPNQMKYLSNGKVPPPSELTVADSDGKSVLDYISEDLSEDTAANLLDELQKVQNKSFLVCQENPALGMLRRPLLRLGNPPIAGDTDGFSVSIGAKFLDRYDMVAKFDIQDENNQDVIRKYLSQSEQRIKDDKLFAEIIASIKHNIGELEVDDDIKGRLLAAITTRLEHRADHYKSIEHQTGSFDVIQLESTNFLNEMERVYSLIASPNNIDKFIHQDEKGVLGDGHSYSATNRLHGLERYNPNKPESFADISGIQIVDGKQVKCYFDNRDAFIAFKQAAHQLDPNHYINCPFALPVYKDTKNVPYEGTDYDMEYWYDLMTDQIVSLHDYFCEEQVNNRNFANDKIDETRIRDKLDNLLGKEVLDSWVYFHDMLDLSELSDEDIERNYPVNHAEMIDKRKAFAPKKENYLLHKANIKDKMHMVVKDLKSREDYKRKSLMPGSQVSTVKNIVSKASGSRNTQDHDLSDALVFKAMLRKEVANSFEGEDGKLIELKPSMLPKPKLNKESEVGRLILQRQKNKAVCDKVAEVTRSRLPRRNVTLKEADLVRIRNEFVKNGPVDKKRTED